MDRKGIGDFLPDPRCGLRVLSAFSDEIQQLIELNIVGGYQTQSMKAKWDKDIDGSCVFCGECDTREHRLLQCSVGQSVRDAFPDAIITLKEHRPEWIFVPLPRQHDMVILLRAYLKLVRPPIIPAAYDVPEGTLKFYTDGGAIHPACACARIASWSVVQDVAVSDKHRKDVACFLNDMDPKFPCFKVVALGIVYGDQTVARGELLALLTAVRAACKYDPLRHAVFVTDAKYVCNVVHLICTGLWKFLLRKMPDGDLIKALAEVWDPNRFKLQKVKSHRSFDPAADFDDLWSIAGNFCADAAATSAFRAVPSDI